MNRPYYCHQCDHKGYVSQKSEKTLRCEYHKTRPVEIFSFTGREPKDTPSPDWCPISKEK